MVEIARRIADSHGMKHPVARVSSLFLVLVGLLPVGCKKDVKPADSEPAAMMEAPADVLAVVFLPDGTKGSELKEVLGAIDPNAGAAVDMMSNMANSEITEALSGLYLEPNAPLRLVIVNPKKFSMPIVFLGALSGTATGDMQLRTINGRKAAGHKAALDAVASFVPSLGAAKRFRVVGFPKNIVTAYREEIDAWPEKMAGMLGTGEDAFSGFLKLYGDFAISLGDNADRVEILTEKAKGRGTFRTLIHVRKGSTLEKVAAIQKASSFEFMRSLPAIDSMVVESNVVAGPAKEVLLEAADDMFRAMYGGSKAERSGEYSKYMREFADMMTGEMAGNFAMNGAHTGTPKMEGVWLWGTENDSNAKAVIDASFAAWGDGSTLELGGTKQTTTYQADAGEHAGTKYGKTISKIEMTHVGEPMNQVSFVAPYKHQMLMVMGSEELMKSTLDSLAAGTKREPSAKVKRALDVAKGRKASAIMVMDMTSMMGPAASQAKVPVISMTMSFRATEVEIDLDMFATK